ncbi:PilW family protein [Microbulbifer sp. 2205BS26-8]|uniref:PilW family protein n=1 Tax=Microbulbifer sp. 2205BS26-8 TaxID=3064386 RepID=UPI00273FBB7A|nr:PilW family protein [Microbulbifer sp. 2205BS26-8]MDP5208467.1 PilW family protein [Microbulbifer sp. 2205BS26-8]
MYKQWGISLVELMVSITVGLVLMAGVVQLFLSSKLTFTTQQAMSRVQETGRLAMEFMSEDIRMAGHMGCLNVASFGPDNKFFRNFLKDETTLAYNYEVAVDGMDASKVKDEYPEPPNGGVLAGTDALLIRSASGRNVGIARKNDPTQLFIENTGVETGECDNGTNKTDKYSGLCAGDILAVADCDSVRVFQATGFTGSAGSAEIGVQHTDDSSFTPGNRVATWGAEDIDERQTFGKDAQILTIQNIFYYIANNTTNNPSLFRQVNKDGPQELLQGVEDMQLTYGVDTNSDGTPDTYRPAHQIAANQWGSVSSVRLELLVASTEDNVLQEPQGYTFNGVPVDDPGDRRLRQVFSTTVAIRGLLP